MLKEILFIKYNFHLLREKNIFYGVKIAGKFIPLSGPLIINTEFLIGEMWLKIRCQPLLATELKGDPNIWLVLFHISSESNAKEQTEKEKENSAEIISSLNENFLI